MVHEQADEIAALQLENAWLKEQKQQQVLPAKDRLKLCPVDVDGVLWYFKVPRFQRNGKSYTAEDVMLNEPLLRSILDDPYQMILKKVITNPFQ